MLVHHINEQEGDTEEEHGEHEDEGQGGQQQSELLLRRAPRLLRVLPCRLQGVSVMRAAEGGKQ